MQLLIVVKAIYLLGRLAERKFFLESIHLFSTDLEASRHDYRISYESKQSLGQLIFYDLKDWLDLKQGVIIYHHDSLR